MPLLKFLTVDFGVFQTLQNPQLFRVVCFIIS